MSKCIASLGPHWPRAALAIGLAVLVIASNMGLLAAAAYVIAAASVTHLMALLIIPMYAVRILSATRAGARYAERLHAHTLTFDLLARLRVDLFDRLGRLGPARLERMRSGDMLARTMGDVEQLQNAYLRLFSPAAVAVVVVAGLGALLYTIGHALAAWTMLCLIVGVAVAPMAVWWASRAAGRERIDARAQLQVALTDGIQGCVDLQTNGAEQRHLATVGSSISYIAGLERRLAWIAAARESATEGIASVVMLCALAFAIPLVTAHRLNALYIAVPALLALAAFEAVRPLGEAAETVSATRVAARRVSALHPSMPSRLPAHSADHSERTGYDIDLHGATLRYTPGSSPALVDVDLRIPAGTRVAVVGPSGAGKSSLVHLLTGAWEPTQGAVTLGGVRIQDLSLSERRAMVGVVSQDAYMFNDSVRANLLLARPDATEPQLWAVLDAVSMQDAVYALPDGLDSWIGEHGVRLSGGERQRIAIARLLLRDTPIVILDEVTANLDATTERNVLAVLDRATQGRTVIWVTHRLIALDRMDDIIVLDRGRVIERGSEESLFRAGGLYRRMLDIQNTLLSA